MSYLFNGYDTRRLKSGYSDLGPIQIPPKPQPVILTDRTTGQKWMVSFQTNPERITITQDLFALSKRDGARVYGKDDGPAFDIDGQLILFLDNGRLGIRYTQFPVGELAYNTNPIYARQIANQRLVNTDVANIATLHLGYVA